MATSKKDHAKIYSDIEGRMKDSSLGQPMLEGSCKFIMMHLSIKFGLKIFVEFLCYKHDKIQEEQCDLRTLFKNFDQVSPIQ